MTGRVLVTGATGKVGSRLVDKLRGTGVETRAATREPRRDGDVRFDWREPATFALALDGVTRVYLIAPTGTAASLAEMQPFLEAGLAQPRRLVLQSASLFSKGGPMMGEVHGWLAAHADDWTVLRPSWFMQNFTTQYLDDIRRDGAVYSATGEGRVPFIDATDIAAVAAAALTGPDQSGADPVLTGPQSLSYDEVAALLSEVSGRRVRHVSLTVEALARRYERFGLPADYAAILAGMDGAIAQGAEDRTTPDVERWTGRPPTDLRSFLERNKHLFQS